MISVDRALETILEKVEPLPARPFLLGESLGLALAQEVVCQEAHPPFDNSAMDGFAVRSQDIIQVPCSLEIVEEISAGAPPKRTVGPNQAAKIMTGAVMPDGADCVVMVESTQSDDSTVTILATAVAQENVRFRGEHLQPGQSVLKIGHGLNASSISLAAYLGFATLECVPRVRVGIVSSGDELVEPGSLLGPGQIYNSNSYGLECKARQLGCDTSRLPVVPDVLESLKDVLRQQLETQDAVITSAGVAMGEKDFVLRALADLGVEITFWKVAMRPGRPLGFGIAPNGKPVFALPGNPVSSLVTFELFCRPALLKMMGRTEALVLKQARLTERLSKKAGLRLYLRAVVSGSHICTTGSQGSHLLHSLVQSNALLIFPEELQTLEIGDEVSYRDWNG